MAESTPKADGAQTSNASAASPPADMLPGDEGRHETSEEHIEDKQAVQDPSAQASTSTPAPDSASKGKDKNEPPPPAEKEREGDSLSIGPTDPPPPAITGSSSTDLPVCAITLLLPTGARHPYRIDEKYLAKRNVEMPDMTESGGRDPFSISVYKLKELILREWRDDWEGKPASPSSIRLIHFGKLLDDKEQLKKYHFSQDSPNVVHMSVRPPEMMEEEEPGKGKAGGREARTREGRSGCCVIF